MVPPILRKALPLSFHRVMGSLSEQFRRFVLPGKAQAMAAQAASNPAGPVIRKMPAFSSILEEAKASQSSETRSREKESVSGAPAPELRGSHGALASAGKPSPRPKTVHYRTRPGDTIWDLAVNRFHVDPSGLAKENRISNPRLLRAGQVLKVTRPTYPSSERPVVASWYGQEHHGKPMANGRPFNMYAPTIAHKELPLGTKVELRNPRNGQRVVAVVTDRGPYIEGRDVDLSYGLAKKLHMVEQGVGKLMMRIIG